jgi:cytochrome P450
MTAEDLSESDRKRKAYYHFDRHAVGYRERFGEITKEMQTKCPVAWSDTYGGHWVVSGHQEVFDIARRVDVVSNDHDPEGKRRGYQGVTIPCTFLTQSGFLEMDPPEQRHYRQALNPYLSPAAAARWKPLTDEVVRATIDEIIETGSIDFAHDLANIVPAVLTLAIAGLPIADWPLYCEPIHALVATPFGSPERPELTQKMYEIITNLAAAVAHGRQQARPGLIDALINANINGKALDDKEIIAALVLILIGGLDTTAALTAHALEYLGERPAERARLSKERDTLLDPATEEFLRFFTPASGDARTIRADCEIAGTRFREGERVWLSWAMANRDPSVFPDPDVIDLARAGNRHASFGLGIHRCMGSNVARMTFKAMLTAVLDRLPDYVIDPNATVHYETIGVVQGMLHLQARFTPGPRVGPLLAETLAALQRTCDEQRLADPVTRTVR